MDLPDFGNFEYGLAKLRCGIVSVYVREHLPCERWSDILKAALAKKKNPS
jgi:hypothetical protein